MTVMQTSDAPQPLAPVPDGITLDAAPVPEGITLDSMPSAPPPGITVVGEAPGLQTKSWLGSSSIGRVLKSLGSGFAEGFGDSRVGLSDETQQVLRERNILPGIEKSIFDPIKTFNQALLLPAAAAADTAVRGAYALVYSGASVIGQTAQELGEDQGMSERLKRDVLGLADTVSIVTGMYAGAPSASRAGRAVPKAIDTPEFDRWFAGSKIVDGDGSPLRVYHGTGAVIDEFSGTVNTAGGRGIYFTATADDANTYAWAKGAAVDGTGVVYPSYLSVKNPKVIDDAGFWQKIKDEYSRRTKGYGARAPGEKLSSYISESEMKKLEAEGYDGIINNYTNEIVVFRPEQIRSAVSPQFDVAPVRAAAMDRPIEQTSQLPKPPIEPPKAPTQAFDKSLDGPIDRAGNINLDRIQASEDVKNVIREAAEQNGGFVDARRGVMSFEQMQDLADASGFKTEDLINRGVGRAFSAEEAVWARNMLVQSADEVREAALKARNGTDEDKLAFHETALKHAAIQEQVAGLTAEAGRALASFKIMAKGTGEAKDIGKILAEMGGRDTLADIAQKITELDTPQQISKFMADARKVKTSDQLLEAWINALLSGPQTHATNILSNTLTALWAVPETAVAAGIGKARQLLTGSKEERVLAGEAGARLFAMAQGTKEGIIAGWKTFKTEVPSFQEGKIEANQYRTIPSAKISAFGRDFEVGGKQIRLPGRFLMAEDEVFRAIAMRQELSALAYRRASREGLTGDAFAERVGQLLDNPTKTMMDKAREAAAEQTFTKPLGRTGAAVQQFANSHPAAKVVMPFIRTPVNIVKYYGERSPFGLLSKNIRADLAGENGAIARDTAQARLTLGTAVATMAAGLAAEGSITGGGPTDPAERAVMFLNGWQPYSVKIGDTWYSYGRLEPLGMMLGIAADMHDIGDKMTEAEADKIASMIVGSVSKNLINKTWLSGPADLVQAVSDPDRYGDQYVRRLVGSLVPTGLAQIAREEDPVLRDARSLTDQVLSRVPGLSTSVLPRRDIWGEEIALEGSAGPDLLSPIYESKIKNDPVNQALQRLEIFPAKLQRKVHGVELTEQQYDDLQRISGRLSKMTLDGVVAQPGFGQLPVYSQIEIVKSTMANTRDSAQTLFLMRNPDVLKAAQELKVKKIVDPLGAK